MEIVDWEIAKYFAISLLIVVPIIVVLICLIHKRRKTLNEQYNIMVQNGKIWTLLTSLSTDDFLSKLKEFMLAFKDGTLRMSREKLTLAVRVRRDRLRSDLYKAKVLNPRRQLKLISEALLTIRDFIKLNFVETKQRRKRLKSKVPYFRHLVCNLNHHADEPRSFFAVDNSSGKIPFEELRTIFTKFLASAGARWDLRVEAKRLLADLEKKWRELRILEDAGADKDREVELWKEFYKENKDLIDEVLDKDDFYYNGWPDL